MKVFDYVRMLLCEHAGCEYEDVMLAATFDELNVQPFEREALALLLEETYDVRVSDEALESFETVEDLVGYVEDRL